MEPRIVQAPVETQKAERLRKRCFQIVKLEERIAPCVRWRYGYGTRYKVHYKGKCP